MTSKIARDIREYIADNYLFREVESLADDQSLVESGVIDSMGVLGLVTFLEESYSIKVPDEDVVPENLDSIERIVAYLGRRLRDVSAMVSGDAN